MSTTRTEINRANAQHSTGPKTEEGKQRSSLNALRHGLTSDQVLIPGEDPAIYDAHVAAIYDEHDPQTETESILVQLLADLSWRLLRVATLEANLLAQNINYSTYYHQNERLSAFDKLSRALSNLSLHSQRISRQFDKTLAELRNLQKTRPEVSGAHPSTDALLSGAHRSTDAQLSGAHRSTDALLSGAHRSTDALLSGAHRSTDAQLSAGFVFSPNEISAAQKVGTHESRTKDGRHHRQKAAA